MRIFIALLWCWVAGFSQHHLYTQDPIFQATTPVYLTGNPANPPVVLVHGLGKEASSIWESTAALLEQDFYVLRFDLPGFGKASKGNHLYGPEQYAAFIHHLTQHYLNRPFHLVGHSMGAAIALHYTHTYKTEVQSLVLISAAGILHHKAYSAFVIGQKADNFSEDHFLGQHLPTQALGRFFQRVSTRANPPDPQTILASETLRQTFLRGNPASIAALALAHTTFNGIPNNVAQNTTIIWGERDDVAPLQTAYVLHKLMPNATLATLPEAGHTPMLTHEAPFFSLLKDHFYHFTPDPWVPPHPNPTAKKALLQHADNHTLSGTFEELTIYNSRNVRIHNAHIAALTIINGDVSIEHSVIAPTTHSIHLQNSTVSIVASTISGHVRLHATTLNLAGVSLYSGAQNPFVSSRSSRLIYSLCTINNHSVHGQETR